MIKVNRGEWPSRGLIFTVNSATFHCPYYILDGIYPRYSLLVSRHANPTTPQERTFNRLQGALRKNVEGLYTVLKARFQASLLPARTSYVCTLLGTAKARYSTI